MVLAASYLHVPARRLRALLRGQEQALREWIALDGSRKVAHARHQAKIAAHRLEQLHASLVTIADARYPAGLRELEDPPPFLCVRGTLFETGIAVVGTRYPDPAARDFARELARSFSFPVISGLARGIDAAAHAGALEARALTAAYVGTGLGLTYPAEHRALEEAIVAAGGAIATERLPDEPVTKWSLVHRDRLQAAHAFAVVLVASEKEGGAMQTMRFAKDLNRLRFVLVPGSGSRYSGNELARAAGAIALPGDAAAACRIIRTTIAKGTAALATGRHIGSRTPR